VTLPRPGLLSDDTRKPISGRHRAFSPSSRIGNMIDPGV
jgi:hypothetical protein